MEPPKKDDDTEEATSFCDRHPYVCGALGGAGALGVGIGIGAGILGVGEGILDGLGGLVFCAANPELCFEGPPTPPKPPEPPDNNKPPEKKEPEEPKKPPRVEFSRVNADNTPPGSPDRIPPRVNTPVAVIVTDPPAEAAPIIIEIQGAGVILGNATLDGGSSVPVHDSTVIDLQGTLMSKAEKQPGALQLTARYGGAVVGRSNYFGVSAIPQNVRVVFESGVNNGQHMILRVGTFWESDSGNTGDLDGVEWIESVETDDAGATGMFKGFPEGKADEVKSPGNEPQPVVDRHGTRISLITGLGKQETRQLLEYDDNRVHSPWNAMVNSGFLITREVSEDTTRIPADPLAPCLKLTTSKTGVSASIRGLSSSAGSASPDPCVADFQLPCAQFGLVIREPEGGGGGQGGPGGRIGQGMGGGAGKRSKPKGGSGAGPAATEGGGAGSGGKGGEGETRIHPKHITGKFTDQSAGVFYGSGLPASPVKGQTYPIIIRYTLAGQHYTSEIPYKVVDVTSDSVQLVSMNDDELNLAPGGQPPAVMQPHSAAQVKVSVLQKK